MKIEIFKIKNPFLTLEEPTIRILSFVPTFISFLYHNFIYNKCRNNICLQPNIYKRLRAKIN